MKPYGKDKWYNKKYLEKALSCKTAWVTIAKNIIEFQFEIDETDQFCVLH